MIFKLWIALWGYILKNFYIKINMDSENDVTSEKQICKTEELKTRKQELLKWSGDGEFYITFD